MNGNLFLCLVLGTKTLGKCFTICDTKCPWGIVGSEVSLFLKLNRFVIKRAL